MRLHRLVGALVVFAALTSISFAQYAPGIRPGEVGLPYFESRVISTVDSADGSPVVRVFIQLINDNLTFVHNDSGYVAEIQAEVYLSQKETDFVFNRTINREIFTRNYPETNSRDIANTFFTDLDVDPGEYEAAVSVLDMNSNKQFSRKSKFYVPELSRQNQVFVSDILFFTRFSKDSSGMIIDFVPALSNNFSTEGKYVYAYFTTYTKSPGDSLKIHYKIRDDRGVVVQQNQYNAKIVDRFAEHFLRLSRYYFNRNRYQIEVAINLNNQWISRKANFAFFWQFSPNTQQDLDLAIRQMRYIAQEDSIKFYQNADFEAKKAFFKRFWLRQDPNPDTEDNEIMDEYYRRVNFANQHFSATGLSGWLTDRGRIFIKFGAPDDIERHPFESDSYPFVVWQYYNLRKRFVFIDRTGFGDYVLHPSYYYVEYE